MIRLFAVLAAIGAALLTAPAAFAVTYTVNDNGDEPDASPLPGDPCATATGRCTLRAAITQANATPGADAIAFTAGGQAPAPTFALPAVTEQLSIDGGGNTTVSFAASALGTLLDLQAPNVTVKSLVLAGGGAGTVVTLGGSGNRLDTVTVQDAPGTAIRMAGGSGRVDGSRVQNTGATGIAVSGASATIASPTVTGTAGPGIDISAGSASVSSPEIAGAGSSGISVSGDGAAISGGHIHGNSGDGVAITGQNDTVSHVVFFGNGGKPIRRASGGIQPPQDLRIGPRRADGTLPLTGSGSAGTLELWSGDPSSASAPSFLDGFGIAGGFTYNFASDPAPGRVFAANLIAGGVGSSEFATVAVPADVESPIVTFARALDTANVRVDFNEPIDPNSVQPSDFKLTMAGLDRAISSLSVGPDGRFVTLTSSGWKAGEAGYVELTGAGVVTDSAGNALLTAPRLRVAAAPGDFVSPLGARLAVTPKTICLTHGRNCRKPGMVIKFLTTEPGKARMVIKRSNKTVGSRLYGKIVEGLNTLKFNGRLGSRKLRAGRYRLLMYLQDQVGNITDQPPIILFNVRRVTR